MKVSYKGKLLISTPSILGDIFSRTVVLITEHDEDGAFGLILNKKNNFLTSATTHILGTELDVYIGGPVDVKKIFFIVKGKPSQKSDFAINDNYYLTLNMRYIILSMMNNTIAQDSFKVFSGYSGWEKNQLENEVKQKQWIVVDEPNFDYISKEDATLWKSFMQNLGGEHLLWANAPEDITMN